MLYTRVVTGFILGALGYLVINDTHRIMKLNKIEILLTILLSDIAHLKDELVDKKEFKECMEALDIEEMINRKTGEVNPNLIYDDDTPTCDENVRADDSSSDEWREVEEK